MRLMGLLKKEEDRYIRIEEIEDLKNLFKGKSITLPDLQGNGFVHIMMAEPGYDRLREIINQAIRESIMSNIQR